MITGDSGLTLSRWKNGYFALFVLWLSYIVQYLNRRNISITLTTLIKELGINYSQAGFLITFFFVAYALMQIPSGWLSDRLGGKKVVVMGSVITAVSSYLSGVFSTYLPLLISRLTCGVGQGMAWPSSSKIVQERFSRERRGLAMGVLVTATSLGGFLALISSSLILKSLDWRQTFYIPALIMVITTICLIVFIRDAHQSNPHYEGSKVKTLEIVKNPAILKFVIAYFCWKYAFEGTFYWIPTFFLVEFNTPVMETGFLVGLALLTGLVSMPLGGVISDKLRNRELIIVVSLFTPGLCLLSLLFTQDFYLIVAAMLLIGFLATLSEGVFFVMPAEIFGIEVSGVGTGIINTGGSLGTIAAPILVGLLLDAYSSFSLVFLMFGLVSLAGGFLVLFGPKVKE